MEYEADQRHAELIIKEMEMQAANPVTIPGTADTKEEAESYQESPELRQANATAFRGLAA